MRPNGADEVSELLVQSPIFNETILLDFWLGYPYSIFGFGILNFYLIFYRYLIVRIPLLKYKLGIDSSIKIFRVDAEGGSTRAAMTTLGLILTNSSSVKEWNRIEHHRVSINQL